MRKSVLLVLLGIAVGVLATIFIPWRSQSQSVSKLQDKIRSEINRKWGEGTCVYVELRPISETEYVGDVKYAFRTAEIHVRVEKSKAKFEYPISNYGTTTLVSGEVKLE